jgi:hypothetical protein
MYDGNSSSKEGDMTRVNGLLALVLGATLVLAGCGGDNGNDDEDTGVDITVDLTTDLSSDGIPDPSTEPPEEVIEDARPEGMGDGRVGEACEANTDCGGIPSSAPNCMTDIMGYVEFPGGYCSADCTSDSDCGDTDEGTCINAYIMTLCLKNCTESSQCRTDEDYECGELPSILGIEGTFCLPAFEMPDMPPDADTDPEEDPAEDSTAD